MKTLGLVLLVLLCAGCRKGSDYAQHSEVPGNPGESEESGNPGGPVVPEPATGVLVAAGLATLVATKRRWR